MLVHEVSGSNVCWGWGFVGRTGQVAGRYIKIEPNRNAQMLAGDQQSSQNSRRQKGEMKLVNIQETHNY